MNILVFTLCVLIFTLCGGGGLVGWLLRLPSLALQMDKPNRAPHRKANFEIIIRSMSSSAGHKRKHSSDSEDDEETGSAMSQADNVDANETEVDEEVGATTQSQADEDVDATQGQTDDEDEQDTQQNEPHDSLGLVAPTTLADSFVDGLDAEAPIIESVPLDNTLPHLNAASSHVEAAALTLIATHNPIKRESSMEEIDLTAHVPESVPIPALPRRGRPRRQQPAPQHMAAAAAAPTAPAAPSGVPLHWPQSMPSAQFTGYAAIPNGQGLRHAMGMSNAPFSGHAMGMSNAQFFGHAAGIPNALFPGYVVVLRHALTLTLVLTISVVTDISSKSLSAPSAYPSMLLDNCSAALRDGLPQIYSMSV